MTSAAAPITVDIHLSLTLSPESVDALGASLSASADPATAVAKAQSIPVVLPLRVNDAALAAFSDLAGISVDDLTGAKLTMTMATSGGGSNSGPEPAAV